MDTPKDPTPGPAQPAEPLPTEPAPTPPPAAAPPPPPHAAPPSPPPPATWEPPPDLTAGPAPGYSFGGAGERLVAYIIDSLVVGVLAILVSIVGLVLLVLAPVLGVIVWVVGFLAVFLGYFPYCWVHGGQTLGKKPFDLYVVRDSDGGPIGWGAAILRLIGLSLIDWIVFGIPIGLLWVFFDARKRSWHDLIAGTLVVKKL
jgi:uncharacterized RDD family membrane protein YckC